MQRRVYLNDKILSHRGSIESRKLCRMEGEGAHLPLSPLLQCLASTAKFFRLQTTLASKLYELRRELKQPANLPPQQWPPPLMLTPQMLLPGSHGAPWILSASGEIDPRAAHGDRSCAVEHTRSFCPASCTARTVFLHCILFYSWSVL